MAVSRLLLFPKTVGPRDGPRENLKNENGHETAKNGPYGAQNSPKWSPRPQRQSGDIEKSRIHQKMTENMQKYVHFYVNIYVYVYIYMYVRMYVYINIHIHNISLYIYVYIYMYI